MQLNLVSEWVPCVPHHLGLLGGGSIESVLLAQMVKRLKSLQHLLVHYIVAKTSVPQS